jgi:hypothetical protein
MSENVGASTSRNPKGLHGLYTDNFTLLCRSILHYVMDSIVFFIVIAIKRVIVLEAANIYIFFKLSHFVYIVNVCKKSFAIYSVISL